MCAPANVRALEEKHFSHTCATPVRPVRPVRSLDLYNNFKREEWAVKWAAWAVYLCGAEKPDQRSPSMTRFVRKAALARHLGVARSTITRAAQAGRLVAVPDRPGLYDLDASAQRFESTRGDRPDLVARHAQQRVSESTSAAHTTAATASAANPNEHQAPPLSASATAPVVPPPASSASTTPTPPSGQAHNPPDEPEALTAPVIIAGHDRVDVQTDKLAVQNAITKLEIALDRGRRLLLSDVEREAHGMGLRLQDHLTRVIDQSAARLAVTTDTAERRRILARELHRVRRAFDQGGIDALRTLRRARNSAQQRAEQDTDA